VNPKTRIASKRRFRFLNGIDVSAFLAIQLAILFLFLGEVTPVDVRRPVADLPTVDHPSSMPDANREDAPTITVTRDGHVYFRTQQVMLNDVPNQIRQALKEGARPTVFVHADTRAKYGDVAAVIDQVRQAGIQHVGIITSQRQPLLR
jgi:biopolymer transport protein ExbD/biopolymer transport protein TolR